MVFLVLLIIAWAWFEQSAKNTNWEQTFYSSHKIPYGSFILNENLEQFNADIAFETNSGNFYETLPEKDSLDSVSCLIIITHKFFPDSLSLQKLNQFIDNGNTVFISAQYFSEELVPNHEIEIKHAHIHQNSKTSQISLLADTGSDASDYKFDNISQYSYFEISKNTRIKTLGKENGQSNFIEIPKENGRLLLHSQPLAFTNYHILYNHHQYASSVMDDVTVGTNKIIWDNYYNPYFEKNKSILSIVLSKPALRNSLYLTLIFLCIFILFYAKRKQRIIPLIKPTENHSLAFIDTIGRLYFQHGNHKDLVEKQFNLFNYFVKQKFLLTHIDKRNDFITYLSVKSGVEVSIINDIYTNYNQLIKQEIVTESQLHIFNNQIRRFHKNIKQK